VHERAVWLSMVSRRARTLTIGTDAHDIIITNIGSGRRTAALGIVCEWRADVVRRGGGRAQLVARARSIVGTCAHMRWQSSMRHDSRCGRTQSQLCH
jgi:hypothetical protein